MVANLNNVRLSHGKPKLGLLNPWLYSTAHTDGGFVDITKGRSGGCTGTTQNGFKGPKIENAGFSAVRSWDPVTGWGSPNFKKLAKMVLDI